MKHIQRAICMMMIMLGVSACSDDESLLENKWQLRQIQHDEETSGLADHVFYNFQKGSFSAICLHEDGEYYTFFGNYSLNRNEISIVLLPESNYGEVYERYINWENGNRTFTVDKLTGSTLCLEYGGTLFAFRKY